MNSIRILLLTGTLALAAAVEIRADSQLRVDAGAVHQKTTGSHVTSDIAIGASQAPRTSGLDIRVKVNDVTAKATGRGNRSTIQIGSATGRNTGGFTANVVIGGNVVLDTDGSDGAIRIGTRTSD